MYIFSYLWLFVALSGAYVSVFGCMTLPKGEDFNIWNQEGIDNAFQGCTSIDNYINIAHNYTGSFILPSTVTSIRRLTTLDNGALDSLLVPTPNITAIVADGVTTIFSGLSIIGAPSLELVSFPTVSQADRITIMDVGETFTMNFSSLESASAHLEVSANISTVDFPLLVSVHSLFVTGLLEQPGDDKEYPSMNISFPVLNTALSVNISGHISSLSMPMYSSPASQTQFSVSNYGNPLDISLPSLTAADYMFFTGAIASFSFPLLLDVQGLSIDATNPLNVSLAPIDTIRDLSLSGSISGLNMSSVNSIQTLNVTTSLPLDCSSALSTWIRVNGPWSSEYYSCAGQGLPILKKKKPTTTRYAIGCSIAGFFVMLLLCFFGWRKHRKEKALVAANKVPPAYEMEPLPVYTAAGESGSEPYLQNERSAERVLGEGDRSVNRREEVDTR